MYFNTERESVLTADCNRLTIIWRLRKRDLELTDNSNQCWKNLPQWKPVRFSTKVYCFVQYTLWRSYIDTKTVFYWNINIFTEPANFLQKKKGKYGVSWTPIVSRISKICNGPSLLKTLVIIFRTCWREGRKFLKQKMLFKTTFLIPPLTSAFLFVSTKNSNNY